MKKLLLLLLVVLILTGCQPAGTPNLDDHDKANTGSTTGKVTEGTDSEAAIKKADEETIIQIEALISNLKYEDAYKLVGSIKNPIEQKEWYSKFTLIENVLLSQHGECAPDALGNPGETGTIYYAYNSQGQITKAIVEGDWIYTDLCTIMMQDVQKINYLLEYEEYTYNQNGQLTTVTGYNTPSKDRKLYVATFVYNDGGLNSKVEYMTNDGFEVETTFVYDDQGRLSEIKYFRAVYITNSISYDDNGFRIYPNAQVNYDENGRILKITTAEGIVTTYRYGTAYAFEG